MRVAVCAVHLIAVLALTLLQSCGALGGGQASTIGVVGRVTAGAADAQSRPALLVAYDADVFCAWAESQAMAELYWRNSEPRAYVFPPRTVSAGKIVVRVASTKLAWEGAVGDPMPAPARVLFSFAEVQAWHLQFVNLPEP